MAVSVSVFVCEAVRIIIYHSSLLARGGAVG